MEKVSGMEKLQDDRICIIHYEESNSTYSRIKDITAINEERIQKAKRCHENDEKGHEKQCKSIPDTINHDLHGIHMTPCYKNFTRILADQIETIQTPKRSTRSTSDFHSPEPAWIYPKECYLCKMYRVQIKGKKVIPVTISTDDAIATIKAAAETQNPAMYFEIKDLDLCAKEFKTHKHCYKNFTRGYTKMDRGRPKKLPETLPERAYESGNFDAVKTCIINNVISEEKAVSMKTLHEIYGLNVGDNRYRGYLKNKIKEEFSDSVSFVTVKVNTAEVVISTSVFKSSVHHSLHKEASIKAAASLLREDILKACENHQQSLSWPPKLSELESLQIPDTLKTFYKSLFKSDKHGELESENFNRIIPSYAADMINGVTHGKVTTAKHFLLAVGLHSTTGMKHMIRILNKLGHCMSYDKTLQVETAMAEKIIAKSKQSNILPLKPHGDEIVLTYFWVDNFDVKVETSRGGGSINTTHLMAFQEVCTDSSTANNHIHDDDITIPRSKRRRLDYDVESYDVTEPFVDKIMEPPKFDEVMKSEYSATKFQHLYFLWLCFRKWNSHDQAVSTFSGWATLIRSKRIGMDTITKTTEMYLPPLTTKVTDFSTIQQYMDYLQTLSLTVNMPYVNITLDVGAAMNAFKYIWNNTEKYDNVVVHLGDFHFMKENFQVIGNLVEQSGFEDIVFQSGLMTSGTVKGILSGSDYNGAWLVHSIMVEALERLLLTRFLTEIKPSIPTELIYNSDDIQTFDEEHVLSISQDLAEKYENFKDKGRSGGLGKTAQFWIMYIDLMSNQHLIHTAVQENNFEMKILAWENILPFYFYFNKTNYARYGSYYLQQLTQIDTLFPGLKALLAKNGMSVQAQSAHHVRTAIDQRGEQTINRDAKTSGGVKGFAGDKSAVLKWCLNRADQSQHVTALKQLAGVISSTELYKPLRPSKILTSERLVSNVIRVLEDEYINPFSVLVDEDKLFNLVSGIPMTDELAQEVLQIRSRGKELASTFARDRLAKLGTVKFHDPLRKNDCKSFTKTSKSILLKTNNKQKTIEVNRDILSWLVNIAATTSSQINYDIALTYPLAPVPLSLATPEGIRRGTSKSKLLEPITKNLSSAPTSLKEMNIDKEKPCSLVVDLIAAVRTATNIPVTYEDFTWQLVSKIPKGFTRVDLVADTYRSVSIKDAERNKRGTSTRVMIKSPASKIPRNFTNFLKNGDNKTRLIELICEVLQTKPDKALKTIKTKKIFYSKEEDCVLISGEGASQVQELTSNQEEADTKVILHCIHALENQEATVVLRNPSGDTDIVVLAISLIEQHRERLIIDYGNGKNRKAFRISHITFREEIRKALLGFHAFTGNDYISSFFMKGKIKAWGKMLKHEKFITAFAEFGTAWTVEESTSLTLEEYVCFLYGYKSTSVNQVRARMFNKAVSQGKRAPDISLLPPCQSVLKLHITRANYVAKVWRSSTTAWIECPDITDFGWESDGTPTWVNQAFPEDITELLVQKETELEDRTIDDDEESDVDIEELDHDSEEESDGETFDNYFE